MQIVGDDYQSTTMLLCYQIGCYDDIVGDGSKRREFILVEGVNCE